MFFIVGAAKAGTTSLYHYLDQHPDIYMSPMKEPTYFSFEVRPENFETDRLKQAEMAVENAIRYVQGPMNEKRLSGIVCDWEHYQRLFAAATTQRALGEASVAYLWSPSAAREIARRIPHARIIMILRAPAERAFSQYLHAVSDGILAQPFRDYVRACLRDGGEGFGIHRPFLEIGFYADQVQRYLDHFPREQIGIWIYEEAKGRQREFVSEVFEFLGVDREFRPDISRRYLEPHIPRMIKPRNALQQAGIWKLFKRLTPAALKPLIKNAVYRPMGSTTLEAQDKALLLDFYRNDIRRLEGILGRDLGLWLA